MPIDMLTGEETITLGLRDTGMSSTCSVLPDFKSCEYGVCEHI